MTTITVVALDGEQKELAFNNGDSLMELLRDADYDEIAAMCGGCCSCATCHVKIDQQEKFALPPVEEDEEMLLAITDEYDQSQSRLSCQLSLSDEQNGMVVKIVEPE